MAAIDEPFLRSFLAPLLDRWGIEGVTTKALGDTEEGGGGGAPGYALAVKLPSRKREFLREFSEHLGELGVPWFLLETTEPATRPKAAFFETILSRWRAHEYALCAVIPRLRTPVDAAKRHWIQRELTMPSGWWMPKD